MRIYLAGGIDHKGHLKAAREQLIRMNHTITSRWIDDENKLVVGQPDYLAYAQKWADNDMDDMMRADMIAADVETGGRGTFFEIGYALGFNHSLHTRIKIALIGERPNSVFMHANITGVYHFKDWGHFLHEI
ncbi:MAG: nucleoside 2-deoxyribosyltransferase [Nitrospiraceae bacterium]